MNKEIMIRKAKIDDLNTIFNIYKSAIKVMDENNIPQWDEVYPNVEVLKEDILKGEMLLGVIDNSIAVVAVINKECDEEYKKACWRFPNLSYLIIHRLCVNPQFQNLGVGTRMMTLIEGLLLNEGIKSIRLDSFSLNPYALRMYEKLGYVRVGSANWRKGLFYLYEKKIGE